MHTYENITLRFNDTLGYHIPPKSYLKTETLSNGRKICYNMVIYSSAFNTIVLGDVFLENYYAVYDFENTTISFNGWVQEDLEQLQSRVGNPLTTIIIVVLVCVLVIAIGAGAVIFIKRRNEKLRQNLQL